MYKFLYNLETNTSPDEFTPENSFLVLSLLIALVLGVVFLVKLVYFFYMGENLYTLLPIEAYSIFLAALLLICIIDGVIYFGTAYVTENESTVKYYISKHVAPKSWTNASPIEALLWPNILISGWVTVCWLILGLFPFIWFIIGAVLAIYGILEILRRGWKIQKKLGTHIKDPDAHANKGEQ